jgi:hypothetical protein
MKPNPILQYSNCVMPLANLSAVDAWNIAKDVVEYPISIENLRTLSPHTTKSNVIIAANECEIVRAKSVKGSIGPIFGVLVDRDRSGQSYLINTCSSRYTLKPTADVYSEIQTQLTELNINHRLESVYVSSNGGQQQLTINLIDLSFKSNSAGEYNLALLVTTSIDGSKAHQLDLIVIDNRGIPLYGMESISLNFFTKHTSKMIDRLTAFNIILESVTTNWNEVILPLLVIMDTPGKNQSFVIDAVKSMLDSGDIPDRHIEAYMDAMAEPPRTILQAMTQMGSYFEETMSDRYERKQALRAKFNKSASKILSELNIA